VAAHWAGKADSYRRGCLLAGLARVGADREPLIGIETAIRTPGVPLTRAHEADPVNRPGIGAM
jgi:hypothetical protein